MKTNIIAFIKNPKHIQYVNFRTDFIFHIPFLKKLNVKFNYFKSLSNCLPRCCHKLSLYASATVHAYVI
ncbi:hypothetical protein Hanom_Chr17g01529221 [Helianthus anomalus]